MERERERENRNKIWKRNERREEGRGLPKLERKETTKYKENAETKEFSRKEP